MPRETWPAQHTAERGAREIVRERVSLLGQIRVHVWTLVVNGYQNYPYIAGFRSAVASEDRTQRVIRRQHEGIKVWCSGSRIAHRGRR